jgi:hypothetical protein
MGLLKKISEVRKYDKRVAVGKAVIDYENGECSISSSVDVMGMEIHFRGKAIITPDLPQGWYLRGKEGKMIIFTLQNIPIKNSLLFKYEGTITITKAIVANTEGKKVKCSIKKDNSKWTEQGFKMDSESVSWDRFKDIRPNGKVNKTSYIIDDDLPEVEQIKETKIRRTRRTTRRSSGGGY